MSVSTRSLWRALAISAALIFAYASVLKKLVNDWWFDDNYSHGLLIPLAIGYILWSRRKVFQRETLKPSAVWGGAAVVIALLTLWAGVAGAELYIQRLSLVLILAGTIVYFWGFRFLQLTIVPFALLLLALPIPSIVFNKVAFPLQLLASRVAVWSMSLFGIPVLRQGNVIELLPLNALKTKKLEVVEACSGIRSLMTLVTLALVFAYFTHPRSGGPSDGGDVEAPNRDKQQKLRGKFRQILKSLASYKFWRPTIIILSAVPIAIFTNALRVSGTGILSHFYGTEIADGFFHSFSGWVIYVVAFLLLFAVGWLVDRFDPSSRKSEGKQNTATEVDEQPSGAARRVVRAEGAE